MEHFKNLHNETIFKNYFEAQVINTVYHGTLKNISCLSRRKVGNNYVNWERETIPGRDRRRYKGQQWEGQATSEDAERPLRLDLEARVVRAEISPEQESMVRPCSFS